MRGLRQHESGRHLSPTESNAFEDEVNDVSKRRLYDERCYDLAVYFIGTEKKDELCADLANDIQQAVEDWFEQHPEAGEQNREPRDEIGRDMMWRRNYIRLRNHVVRSLEQLQREIEVDIKRLERAQQWSEGEKKGITK